MENLNKKETQLIETGKKSSECLLDEIIIRETKFIENGKITFEYLLDEIIILDDLFNEQINRINDELKDKFYTLLEKYPLFDSIWDNYRYYDANEVVVCRQHYTIKKILQALYTKKSTIDKINQVLMNPTDFFEMVAGVKNILHQTE